MFCRGSLYKRWLFSRSVIFAYDQSYRDALIAISSSIPNSEPITDPAQIERALERFRIYYELQEKNLRTFLQAKREALIFIEELPGEEVLPPTAAKPFCLLFAQEIWDRVELSEEVSTINLERSLLSNASLRGYAEQILSTLPSGREQLRQLYRQIATYSRTEEVPKERYRFSIIRGLIQRICIEDFFRSITLDLAPVK